MIKLLRTAVLLHVLSAEIYPVVVLAFAVSWAGNELAQKRTRSLSHG